MYFIRKFSNSPQRNLKFCALRSLFLICSGAHGQALIIGNEMLNTDPLTQDEMARKKEKIMMQSLRRKQAAEEVGGYLFLDRRPSFFFNRSST